MKVLILGAGGMLGHKLFQYLSPRLETWGTIRSEKIAYKGINSFKLNRLIEKVDILDDVKLNDVLQKINPDYLINCVGIVKQIKEANDFKLSIEINSLLPHRLGLLALEYNFNFIQISTDCVFSGQKGSYHEKDFADANDLYGRSKFLGEIHSLKNCITIRTSIIGKELFTSNGLFEWFLKQKKVKGFTNAIFSGLTTNELSSVIYHNILKKKTIGGLFHISSEPINKYELLKLIRKIINSETIISEIDSPKIDRSLNCQKFITATGYQPKNWEQMVVEMIANDK